MQYNVKWLIGLNEVVSYLIESSFNYIWDKFPEQTVVWLEWKCYFWIIKRIFRQMKKCGILRQIMYIYISFFNAFMTSGQTIQTRSQMPLHPLSPMLSNRAHYKWWYVDQSLGKNISFRRYHRYNENELAKQFLFLCLSCLFSFGTLTILGRQYLATVCHHFFL